MSLLNVADYEREAERLLDPGPFGYYAGGAVLGPEQRVLGREDPLQQDGQQALVAQPLEIAPAQGGVDDLAERCVEPLSLQ